MSIKIASIAAAVALSGFIAAANAGEAISLNQSQMDGITAGWRTYNSFNFKFKKDIDVNKDIRVNIDKRVNARVDVKGNLAEAEALAECFGNNCLAETLTGSQTTPWSGAAFSESTSATK